MDNNLVIFHKKSFFGKIATFFYNIFRKPNEKHYLIIDYTEMLPEGKNTENTEDSNDELINEVTEVTIDKKTSKFLELQLKYEKNEIAEEQLTESEIISLEELYTSQITELKELYNKKKKECENYQKKLQIS